VLCALQEAGEAQAVLAVGEQLLEDRPPKQFKQDVVLAMALAYVDLSRDSMAASPPDVIFCCEVLERALKLLQVSYLHHRTLNADLTCLWLPLHKQFFY
jgi:hypothetical protein